jgi:Ser/Thr protein kinase RdoA (MazF antagonist)
MVMLESTNSMKTNCHKLQSSAALAALPYILDQYRISARNIKQIEIGNENHTFIALCDDDQYVLRIYRQSRKAYDAIRREVDFMQYLADHHMPVPRVLENSQGKFVSEATIGSFDWQGILMQFMPGEHLRTTTPAILSEMAKFQAKLHLLGRTYLEASLEREDALRHTASKPIQRLPFAIIHRTQVIMRHLLPYGFCHYDFTINNLLTNDEHIVAILDFDDMSTAPLANCLAIALTRMPSAARNRETIRQYIADYETIRPLSRFEMHYLTVKRALSWARRLIGLSV